MKGWAQEKEKNLKKKGNPNGIMWAPNPVMSNWAQPWLFTYMDQ